MGEVVITGVVLSWKRHLAFVHPQKMPTGLQFVLQLLQKTREVFRISDGLHVVLEAHSRDSAARHHLRIVGLLLQARCEQELRAAGPFTAAPLRPDRPPSSSFPRCGLPLRATA